MTHPGPPPIAPAAAIAPTLGQITGPDTAAVPALPPAPLWQVWLFESPIPLVILLAAAGMIATLILIKLGRRRSALLALLAASALAGGAIAADRLVETDRETLQANTIELVQATATADAEAMRRFLHPEVTLGSGQTRFIPSIEGRERLISAADRVPTAIDKIAVLETRAGLDGPRVGRTQVRLRVFGPGKQLYGHSWWALDWQQHEGEWVAVRIEPLWIQG